MRLGRRLERQLFTLLLYVCTLPMSFFVGRQCSVAWRSSPAVVVYPPTAATRHRHSVIKKTNAGLQIAEATLSVKNTVNRNDLVRNNPDCFVRILIFSRISIYGNVSVSVNESGRARCPTYNSQVEIDFSLGPPDIKNADVVIIPPVLIVKRSTWPVLRKLRPENQPWIMLGVGSPLFTSKKRYDTMHPNRYRKKLFDWTMTFRPDSDFPRPWGYYTEHLTADARPGYISSKVPGSQTVKLKLMAWKPSDCNSSVQFVKTLDEHINIDKYGECGNLYCASGKDCDETMQDVKFYLSIERWSCRHFISVEFWKSLSIYGAVPVVYGPPREDYELVSPPDSFIHISDFRSIKELAEYLTKLDSDDALYNRYHKWRSRGKAYHMDNLSSLFTRDVICDVADRYVNFNRSQTGKHAQERTFFDTLGPLWKGSCQEPSSPHPPIT